MKLYVVALAMLFINDSAFASKELLKKCGNIAREETFKQMGEVEYDESESDFKTRSCKNYVSTNSYVQCLVTIDRGNDDLGDNLKGFNVMLNKNCSKVLLIKNLGTEGDNWTLE